MALELSDALSEYAASARLQDLPSADAARIALPRAAALADFARASEGRLDVLFANGEVNRFGKDEAAKSTVAMVVT